MDGIPSTALPMRGGGSQNAIITPLVAQQDALRREIRELQAENARLRTSYENTLAAVDNQRSARSSSDKQARQAQAEIERLQKELFIARNQHSEAEANLAANLDYVRKLEGRLVNGKQVSSPSANATR